jgi:ribosomal protein S18 acetylase RimI-like enzyme
MENLIVHKARDLTLPGIEELVEESRVNGFRFLTRLMSDWRSGANRFDGPGEALFVALEKRRLVGVCGLNTDPYGGNPDIGRLRHLCVLAECQRQGVGSELISQVVREAETSFARLTLRTDSLQAAAFYEALGFAPTTTMPRTTHYLDLNTRPR